MLLVVPSEEDDAWDCQDDQPQQQHTHSKDNIGPKGNPDATGGGWGCGIGGCGHKTGRGKEGTVVWGDACVSW